MSDDEAAEHKRRLEAQLQRSGGVLPPIPDGPRLDAFSALEMAQALEHEAARSAGMMLTKIRIDLDHADAARLAAFLRRAVAAGA